MKTTRRQALFGAASAALGSSLLLGGRASAGGPSTGRHLIVVYASGGWDTTYALDPKVGAGGVDPTEESVKAWFGAGIVAAGMGSKLITQDLLDAGDWGGIETRVRETVQLIEKYRKK